VVDSIAYNAGLLFALIPKSLKIYLELNKRLIIALVILSKIMLKRLLKVIIMPVLVVLIPLDVVCAIAQFIITGEFRNLWCCLIWE